ncbi:MAG: SDR family oxidoreductase [Bacteroidetes bacterium]|nr:SDR family oxidoreductase [Bacteroidota bacterium]
MDNKKVWYVTGASKGLGLALVKTLLEEGYPVAATSRYRTALTQAVGPDENFLPLEVDLTSEASIADSFKMTHARFGRIDVVVNNAGYGIGGTIEELAADEVTENFDVNVFATIRVIQKAMPYLRAQRGGHILNISSIAGFTGATGWAVYSAAKAAVIALSEVLAQDVSSMGIKVTAIAPGAFRTSFLSPESVAFARNKIADYEDVRASHNRYLAMDGKQIGDPAKAAEVFIQLAESANPPTLLFLGSDSYNRAIAKSTYLCDLLDTWKSVSCSTQIAEPVTA